MRRIKLGSDNVVELVGPVNRATGAAVISGTCKARLFYDDMDTTLRVAVSSGTLLSVESTRRWSVGDRAVIWRDDATWQDLGNVTAVDNDARTITVTTAVASACAKGNRVSRALGTGTAHEVTMSFYQGTATPTPGGLDYGFRGVIKDTQVGLFIGAPIRIEIDLDAGTDARVTEVLRTSVTGGS